MSLAILQNIFICVPWNIFFSCKTYSDDIFLTYNFWVSNL